MSVSKKEDKPQHKFVFSRLLPLGIWQKIRLVSLLMAGAAVNCYKSESFSFRNKKEEEKCTSAVLQKQYLNIGLMNRKRMFSYCESVANMNLR